jgi:hypothetical protein
MRVMFQYMRREDYIERFIWYIFKVGCSIYPFFPTKLNSKFRNVISRRIRPIVYVLTKAATKIKYACIFINSGKEFFNRDF